MAKVKETKLDAFRPQEHNHNTHSQRGMGALEASMRKHGYVSPMTAAADGEILDGSARLETVANVFGDDVMVVEHDGKRPIVMVRTDIPNATTNEARAISIAANRVAEINLTWNAAELLADMQSGIDMAGLFDQSELDALLAGLVPKAPVIDPGGDVSKADELQAKWQVALGDIWQLGKHRLACGDCTDKATVERLMAGEKALLVVTDPPYGVEYADKNKFLNALSKGNSIQTNIEGDHGDKKAIQAMWKAAFSQTYSIMAPGACFYCFMPQGGDQMMMMMMMMEAGIEPRHELIWLKNNHVLGRVDYAYKHEPILYAWKEGGHHFYGDFQTSIIECNKPQKSDLHPTMKPVELIEVLVKNSSKTGEIVCDPFGGSGTTLIACEQLGRQARCIEISPAYCSVILQRFMDMTNTPPVRLTGAVT